MKKRLLLACMIGTALALSSCSSKSDVKGKWSFKTLKGDYAELWLDDQSLVTVRPELPNPYVYDYAHNGDTIIIYQYGQRDRKNFEVGRFLIESHKGDNMNILQDTVHNALNLISSDIEPIKNTETYRNDVLIEYQSRAQAN